MYGSTGGYGGFSIFWIVAVVAAPIIGAIITGGVPDGSNSARGMPPIFFIGGGLTIALLVGSKLLQDRVRRQEEEGPKPTKIDEFAKSLRLLPEVDAATKRPKLTGKRGQIWLAVHLEKKKTRILARHNLKLPAGFSITNTAKSVKPPQSDAQGAVVLGRDLKIAGTDGMAVAWEHPQVASALMAVLSRFPGSSIDSQRITVEGAGLRQDEIADQLEAIERLVGTLKDPPAADMTPPRFPGT